MLMNLVLERQTGSYVSPIPGKLTEKVPFRLACLEPTLSDEVCAACVRVKDKLNKHQFKGSGSHDECTTILVQLRKKFPENFAQVRYVPTNYRGRRRCPSSRDNHSATIVSHSLECFFDGNGLDAVLMPISPTLPFLRNEVAGTDVFTPERIVWNNYSSAGEPASRRYADNFVGHISVF